jgi:hypothetical protein
MEGKELIVRKLVGKLLNRISLELLREDGCDLF